jgi:hypothetical protein
MPGEAPAEPWIAVEEAAPAYGFQAEYAVLVQGSTVSQPGKCLIFRVTTFKPTLLATAPINESS